MIQSATFSKRFREWGIRLLLVLFSFGLTLGLAEIALRVAFPAPADDGDQGGFEFFAYDERLGWDLVPNTEDRHQSPEFDVTIRINSQGMRDEREYTSDKPDGFQRLVVIGDSFSFGHGVEAEEAYPALLEESLPNTEVINLAVTGYGTDQQLLRLIDQGLKWKPDVVLLGLFEGNVFRNARNAYLGYPKPRFELDDSEKDGLNLVNVPVPKTDSPSLIERTRLWQLAGQRGRDLVEHLGHGLAWPVTERILARLDRICRENGARLAVVVLPKDQAVYGTGLRLRLHEKALAEIDAMLTGLDIEHLDLTPMLIEVRNDEALYFPQDGHWTAVAHRRAAEAIHAWLVADWNFSSVSFVKTFGKAMDDVL